ACEALECAGLTALWIVCPVMKLPHAKDAIIDLPKLRDYCLNPFHPKGKHKARSFRANLGLGSTDANVLADLIRAAILTEEAQLRPTDEHGERYIVAFQPKG